jgi:serine/threonine protein kinase
MLEARRGKGLPLPQTLRHSVQVARALVSLHTQGAAVLDLKPANLLSDVLKISDCPGPPGALWRP